MVVSSADCGRKDLAGRRGADDEQRALAAIALASRDSARTRRAGGLRCIPRLNDVPPEENKLSSTRHAAFASAAASSARSRASATSEPARSALCPFMTGAYMRLASRWSSPFTIRTPVEDSARALAIHAPAVLHAPPATCLSERSPRTAAETSNRVTPASTLSACTIASSHSPWVVQQCHDHLCQPT